jgi:hypothetical protein
VGSNPIARSKQIRKNVDECGALCADISASNSLNESLEISLPSCGGQLHCLKHQNQHCGKEESNTNGDELSRPSSVRMRLTFEM